jgi:hypothetical protein
MLRTVLVLVTVVLTALWAVQRRTTAGATGSDAMAGKLPSQRSNPAEASPSTRLSLHLTV